MLATTTILWQQNDFLRQKNKILRSKLGKRAPLTNTDRRTLVRYGLPIKDRLWEVISIVRPETLLSWKQFIQAHLEVTGADDFFIEEVWT